MLFPPQLAARRTRRSHRAAVPPLLIAALIAALGGIAGCGSGERAAGAEGHWAAGSTSSPAATSPSPAPTPGGDITVAFAGDVHFSGRNAALLGHPETAFGPIASVLSAADLAMVNLETSVTERGTEAPKVYHFRAPASAFTAVRAAGVDVVTLANNHVLDYGQVGLSDTISAATTAGFPIVGVGANASAAWAPWITTIKGKRIAIVGVSQVSELASSWVATDTRAGEANTINTSRTLAAVKAARSQADIVIVYMHWGTEGTTCPNSSQKSLAPKLVEAGASIIVGTHAHAMQGGGWLGKTYVAYGLSNFVWWASEDSPDTGVLRLTLPASGPMRAEFVPASISSAGQPIPATGSAATRISQKYAGLRSCTGLSAAPSA